MGRCERSGDNVSQGKYFRSAPLIFLHGWGSTAKIWQRQATYFTATRRPVLVPDYLLQTCRGPSFFITPLTLNNLTDELFALCRRRSLAAVHLIGWSLGGMIALKFAFRFPDLVNSITLVATTPKFVADDSFPDGIGRGELRLLRSRLLRDRLFAFSSFHQLLFADQELSEPLVLKIRDLLKTDQPISDQALVEGLNILEDEDLRPHLPYIKSPALIIHGQKDRLCPVAAAHYLHQQIPCSQLRILPDCGHIPFLTREEEFNQILEEFLQYLEAKASLGLKDSLRINNADQ
ncbi:MAG: alpha/beta hydrolase [bacterium]|nr:alpha/beta hydrolase [bacterium]